MRCARQRQRVLGDVAGDYGAGADIGIVADADRCDQRGVDADKRTRADLGPVLGEAVVIAGDCARAQIGPRTDGGVADIGEVVGLGALAKRGVLDLDEVADTGARADLRSRAQPGERADDGAGADVAVLEMAEGAAPLD